MLTIDSVLAKNYGQTVTVFPVSSPSDPIVFGTKVVYQPFAMLALNEDQRFAIERAKKYALEQSIQNALNKQAAQLQQQDLVSIKRNQALILLSRIYVGSISFEIGEEEIKKTFAPFGPIKSVSLSWDSTLQKHKGFAFIEFEVPEAASLALEHMGGFTLAGRNLKVGRPSNAPQTGSLEAELRSDDDTKNRIYVASVHPELGEADIQTVFEAFGRVDHCVLYPDAKCPGRHRGFGYIGFESEEAALSAVSSMNHFDLAGQQLHVGRALTPKDSPLPFEAAAAAKANGSSAASAQASASAVALAAASITAQVLSMSAEEAATASIPEVRDSAPKPNSVTGFSGPTVSSSDLPPPGVFIPVGVGEAAAKATDQSQPEAQPSVTTSFWDDDNYSEGAPVEPLPSSPVPEIPESNEETEQEDFSLLSFAYSLSRIMILENMVSQEDIDEFLETEVAEECANYGNVLQVVIHVTPSSDVRIFVKFDLAGSAQAACDALNQRFFAGRTVNARLYDEERFQLHEFND